jgi:CubicO group peptidase (beta-lactamase class C family)
MSRAHRIYRSGPTAAALFTPRAALAAAALLVVLAGCSSASPRFASPDYWPTSAWRTVPPEAQGFDSAKLAEGLRAIRSKGLAIHSLLVVRNGDLLLDANFYPYDGSTVHDLASVTKTVTAALIGIAADQGRLRLDDRLLSFFPDRTIANRDARKERITVRDLVTMSSGLDCTPADGERTLREMKASSDWVQFALDLRATAEPGTTFSYCSPGSHLLSAILQKATGMTELQFARRALFEPLGITTLRWPADPQGFTDGWGDLYLQPRDAAKLGYLWASGGAWEGRQVVSTEWIEDSTTARMKTDDDDYGYGWWLPRDVEPREYSAEGRGGQRVTVLPDANTVLVVTGEGLEPGDATNLLAPAFVGGSLPANPQGVEQLTAALAEVAAPPRAQAVSPLPRLAGIISGRTWLFERNAEDLRSVRLDFGPGSEAWLEVQRSDAAPAISGSIGLDGRFRFAPGPSGLPSGLRGAWRNETTFVVEFDEIANNHAYELRFDFADDRLTLSANDRTENAAFTVAAVPAP